MEKVEEIVRLVKNASAKLAEELKMNFLVLHYSGAGHVGKLMRKVTLTYL